MTRVAELASHTASTATSVLKPENKYAQRRIHHSVDPEDLEVAGKNCLFPDEENGDQHKHLRPSNTLT